MRLRQKLAVFRRAEQSRYSGLEPRHQAQQKPDQKPKDWRAKREQRLAATKASRKAARPRKPRRRLARRLARRGKLTTA